MEHDSVVAQAALFPEVAMYRCLTAVFGLACLLSGACGKSGGTRPIIDDVPKNEEIDVGSALFAAAEYKAATPAEPGANPILVPQASVVVLRKLDLPSKVDGTIQWMGVEVDEATAAKLSPHDVFRHPREKKVYRRLAPGMLVKRDQVVALLDDQQAYIQWKAAATKAEGAKKSATLYGETVKELTAIVLKTEDGVRRGIVPEQELLNSRATRARYEADHVDHIGAADNAAAEAEAAKVMWEKHIIRSVIEGEVQQVLKHEGDGVKATEPIAVLHEISSLRAIGNLPKEYANTVSKGYEVAVEFGRDVPSNMIFDLHTTNKPIAAVAVATVGGKPLVVSAGEDGLVQVWDREMKGLAAWRVAGGVRSLAVTRPGVEPPLCLVGGLNGTATLHDLNARGGGRDFEGRHDGGVSAAAFSPDGRYCVTSDERNIHLYDVAMGKRKYTFPAREHHSPITDLHFTPQGRVVSVGREPSVRVWTVGDKNAKVEHRIDSRVGDVAKIGVTEDGSRLLLDADKTQLDVMHLKDMLKERPLSVAGEAGRFGTFALWSPELAGGNRLIATVGAADGVVQLWKAPTAKERGAEVARLVARSGSSATCAAFSQQGENGFVVVGNRRGEVYLWPLPAPDAASGVAATVTNVEQTIESSGRTLPVVVDFANPKGADDQYLLRPGSNVTLVIKPKK